MRDFQSPNRSVVYAANAMAATSHPRASLAAIETLKSGGNAVDAAVAAAAVLAVVEPHMAGIGGDCFVLYAPEGGGIIGYNGSGRAPAAAETEWYLDQGITEIARQGPHAVTIPGTVEAWNRLVSDHGRMPLGDLLQTAIALAEGGYPVHPRVAFDWADAGVMLSRNEAATRVLLPGGQAPRAGSVHRQPELASTLRRIAGEGPDGFYKGPVAEDMVTSLRAKGGLHTLDDFAAVEGEYVAPISTNYRGYDVYECPPNGQGVVALLMLNLCEAFPLGEMECLGAPRLHLEAEVAKLAFRDRDTFLADPKAAPVPVDTLISKGYAAQLRARLSTERALGPIGEPELLTGSDTIYLSVVDADGNAISFISSLFNPFGSGQMSEKTGILFHGRGSSFVVDPAHPNTIAPNKRPMHTIIPGMLAKDGKPVMPFGVMGANYQPVGHFHVLTNILDFDLDLQAALDAPRIFCYGAVLEIESGIDDAVARELEALGHQVKQAGRPLGGGQAIWIDRERGVLTGGSDPRKDGCALGY